MPWCCQATSHYLSQCWSRSLSPYGVTRPQWVKFDCIDHCELILSSLGAILISVYILQMPWHHLVAAEQWDILSHGINIYLPQSTISLSNFKRYFEQQHTDIYVYTVFQITASLSTRSRQLWRRTGNFFKTFLQFYVYDLRFKAAGLTTFLVEFWTLVYIYIHTSQIQNVGQTFNSLTLGRFWWYFRWVIFVLILVIDDWFISCEIAIRWM